MDRGAEYLDTRGVDDVSPECFRIAHGEQLIARWLRIREPGSVIYPLILLLVNRIHRSRIVVVVIECPVPSRVIVEVNTLGHVRINDCAHVAGIDEVVAVGLIGLRNELNCEGRNRIDVGREVVSGDSISVDVGSGGGCTELVIVGRTRSLARWSRSDDGGAARVSAGQGGCPGAALDWSIQNTVGEDAVALVVAHHRHSSGGLSGMLPALLVISKEEQPVLPDGPADNAAELMPL